MYRPLVMVASFAIAVVVASPGRAEGYGLKVEMNKPTRIYAANEELTLTIRTTRDAAVSILRVDPNGALTPVVPASPGALPLIVRPGYPVRYPGQGALKVTQPAGRYELRVTAEPPPATRSLLNADSRLAGRDAREQTSINYDVK